MRTLLIACFVSCALGCDRDAALPEPIAPPPADALPAPADPAVALLTGSLEPAGAWVYPHEDSSLRFGRQGQARVMTLEMARFQPGPMRIVEETAAAVLLRDESARYRYLVWADKAALRHVVVQDTTAVPVGVPVDRGHLQLLRGAPVDIVERRGDRVLVRLADRGLDVTAEVDAAHVRDRVDREPPPLRSVAAPVYVANGTAVRSAPRAGAPLVLRVHGLWVTPVGAAASGWQEIAIETFRARARGFVPVRTIMPVARPPVTAPPVPPAQPPSGHPYDRVIPYGACARDRPGGEIIGILTTEVPTIARPDADGWAWIHSGAGGFAINVAVRLDGPGGPELCMSKQGEPLR